MAAEAQADQAGGSSETNPAVAAFVSFLVPGVGHYIGGLEQRGLYIFLAAAAWYIVMFIGFFLIFGWLMAFVTPLVHIGAGADAFLQLKD